VHERLVRVRRLLVDIEARKPLGLLLDDLDARNRGRARAIAAEADERLDRFRLSLEGRLHRPVRPVAYPAGDGASLCSPRDGEPEPDALNAPLHNDPATDHQTLQATETALAARLPAEPRMLARTAPTRNCLPRPRPRERGIRRCTATGTGCTGLASADSEELAAQRAALEDQRHQLVSRPPTNATARDRGPAHVDSRPAPGARPLRPGRPRRPLQESSACSASARVQPNPLTPMRGAIPG
jgi:hypothetical protein